MSNVTKPLMLHDTCVLQQCLKPPRVIVNGVGLQKLVMSKLTYAKRHACNINDTINYIHVATCMLKLRGMSQAASVLKALLPLLHIYHLTLIIN